MANTRSGNTWYVDTAYASASDNLDASVVVTCIVVTATTAAGRIVLSDASTGDTKLDIRVATAGDSKVIDLSASPISFQNGIKVSTLTTAVATLVGRAAGKAGS